MRAAALHVGRAMATTSATLTVGFLAMQVTRFQAATHIAQLSALAIVAARSLPSCCYCPR